jgi:HAD superfamily hydrolase (TIGR01459 family)
MKAGTIEIFGVRAIAESFDHVLLDQWGTLHEGKRVFPAAHECVTRLREAGKRVLALSNSGKRASDNRQRLAALGLLPESYDGILTSGEITWSGLHARKVEPFTRLGRACFLITRNNDRSIVEGLNIEIVADVRDASFILLAGLDDEAAEPEHWRECLTRAAAGGLPMLCANPDLVMFGRKGLRPAPGALAAFYQSLGGATRFVGKPHAPIFAAALERLGNPDPRRVLMVGDSIHHDIAGGRAAGMLTLLLTAGAHKDTLANSTDLPEAIRSLAGSKRRMPDWMMTYLAW